MKVARKLGVILLSVWLILYGLNILVVFGFAHFGELMGVLAIVAGILLLLER